ncbi:MAG: imidazoleglycerol-phosphate dehydratase HisB [Verrucomicrobiota bacterium]|nr:imidazoleglycerol-phosphate dehydratase HisB [Verrucomicrobiota bacterium]MEC7908082.1 imidazoleglycerol-phosphate dehydratase HisB [Verrucomicrobiota bacterium]MEC8313484.1 imidazoleglycerol-phosphate dehydratase HisB [Verrucomicrobiota bacterium]MEC8517343.1 imidazoleglycerol-phosphate dehydratase HisB [Verrucomicrobiota bacterium]|tara:strand:+ start:866 stop:1474 length:609 start_codon:yes stop_codon:yes gene_type:complete
MEQKRKALIERNTSETNISLELNIDGKGEYNNNTGIAFFDHMLDLLSKHSLIDLNISAKGDLKVDYHHLVEDVGIVLGSALNEALGERKGINRYGFWVLPMDEAQAQSEVCLDLGGRPFFVYTMEHDQKYIRDFDVTILKHFWRSFSDTARMNLHIELKFGEDLHHCIEATFKAVARALRMACSVDPRALDQVPSSKGRLGA